MTIVSDLCAIYMFLFLFHCKQRGRGSRSPLVGLYPQRVTGHKEEYCKVLNEKVKIFIISPGMLDFYNQPSLK